MAYLSMMGWLWLGGARGEDPRLSVAGGGIWLEWQGMAGRTYMVERSDDLSSWRYERWIGAGGGWMSYWLGEGGSGYARLRISERSAPDPWLGDFDEDGVSNREELDAGTDPFKWDSDGDGVSDGGELDQSHDPLDATDCPQAEWFILTGDREMGVEKERARTIHVPAGQSRVVVVLLASDEYPSYTGDGSAYNDMLRWSIQAEGGSGMSGSVDVNDRHGDWLADEESGRRGKGFFPLHLEGGMTLSAPDDRPLKVEVRLAATNVSDGLLPSSVLVGLLPVEVRELRPQVRDGRGALLAGSELPRLAAGRSQPMCEEDPAVERIAHREVRLHIAEGELLAGRSLTWSMEPMFVPPGVAAPTFRGSWAMSPNHPNRFEKSATFGANDFALADQAQARTSLSPAGESAVRINLPPVGLNKARVAIQIAGFSGPPAKVADFEVPAVVVIDPGHGGPEDPGKVNGSAWNHAFSYGLRPRLSEEPRKVGETIEEYKTRIGVSLEKHLTLNWSLELCELVGVELEKRGFGAGRLVLTRFQDINLGIADRASYAPANGADLFLSIHFNASDSDSTLHGPETWIESSEHGNVNFKADNEFAKRIQAALDRTVPKAVQSGSTYRGIKFGQPSDVYLDSRLGNRMDIKPQSRACLAEIAWISNPDIEVDLISGPDAFSNRAALLQAVAEALVEDLVNQE